MVADTLGSAPVRARTRWSLADSAFVLFLLLVFVGLSPFATRDPLALTGQGTGEGDFLRQTAWSGVFVFIGFAALRAKGVAVLKSFPPLIVALLAWCMLSALWAPVPEVAFRRAILESVVVVSTILGVASLGMERSLGLLRVILAGVLIVNWLSIPFVRNAVHLPGEIDPQLVGDWRGIYFHKNIAGSVSAITAILYFFQALRSRSLIDAAICAAAVAFAWMTHSKSSLGFLPVAIAVACLYRFGWRRGIDRAILSVVLLLVGLVLGAIVLKDWSAIAHAFSDPTELTGRTAIWQGEIAFIRDHLLLGAGFGSFSDTGGVSLLHNYFADTWVQNISHGHNAYLQMLVTIGAIGFVLAMIALVASPAREFWRFDPANLSVKSCLLALFVFMVLHNFLESDFLESDDAAWVTFLMMTAALRLMARKRRPIVEPAG